MDPVRNRPTTLLVSSVIVSFNPGTRDVPDSIEAQFANIFRHIGLMLEAGGGDWSHVAKIEFWMPGDGRTALEPFWVEKFPDPDSRPSRHTHIGGTDAVRASFLAYIS